MLGARIVSPWDSEIAGARIVSHWVRDSGMRGIAGARIVSHWVRDNEMRGIVSPWGIMIMF